MALFPKLGKSSEQKSLDSWNPIREMRNLQRDLDRFFSTNIAEPDFSFNSISSFAPSCDLEETNSSYLFSFDIPGMKKEDIKIEVDNNNVLTISGERKDEFEKKDKSFYQKERSCGSFERSFTLPNTVKAAQIEAQYNDGVLKVSVPKAEPTKVTQIKVGESKPGVGEKKH